MPETRMNIDRYTVDVAIGSDMLLFECVTGTTTEALLHQLTGVQKGTGGAAFKLDQGAPQAVSDNYPSNLLFVGSDDARRSVGAIDRNFDESPIFGINITEESLCALARTFATELYVLGPDNFEEFMGRAF